MAITLWLLTTVLFFVAIVAFRQPESCEIFCQGKLLDVVQRSGVFDDSKTFIDMAMKYPSKVILDRFDKLMTKTNGKPTRLELRRFVMHYFSSPGKDIIRFTPKDWRADPKFLKNITDLNLREWAKTLHKLWSALCRKPSESVSKYPNRHSFIFVPNPIIVPGGRYREYYYWDSYWIIIGLLHSEMYATVKGILENYLMLVVRYGFMPTGGRVYFLARSNVPLLIPMVNEYYRFTNDLNFIAKHINTLEMEFNYWMDTHFVEITVTSDTFHLAHYTANSTVPRPDAYLADWQAARKIKSQEGKNQFYKEMNAACESGWGFSTRWYVPGEQFLGKTIRDTRTTKIIPVDLNAILCMNAYVLSTFYSKLKNESKKTEYEEIFKRLKKDIADLLWSDTDHMWYDYDMESKTRRRIFYGSNFVPLWTKCYDKEKENDIVEGVVKYLMKFDISRRMGGVPSSFVKSGLQWDYPNCFPPIQHIIITGLRTTGNVEAEKLAYTLAENWVLANYKGYLITKLMFSKYDTEVPGLPGVAGMYKAQAGYGWTNGICIDLLNVYGRELKCKFSSCAVNQTQLLIVHGFVIFVLTFFSVF